MPSQKSWQDFITSDTRVRVAEANANAGGSRRVTSRDLRMGYSWRPAADPGEANRAADKAKGIEAIDYEPIHVRIIPRENGETFLNYQAAWGKTAKGGNIQVISNCHNGRRKEYPDLLFVKYVQSGMQTDSIFQADDHAVMKLELLADFHVLEETVGQSQFKRQSWKRCAGRGCVHCERGIPTVFGRIVHWTMYPTMRRLLEKQLLEYSTRCANCQKGDLAPAVVVCSGCGAEYINAETGVGNDMSDEQYEMVVNSPIQCSLCGQMGRTSITGYQCTHSVGFGAMRRVQQGCDNPVQYNLAETVFELSTTKSGKVTNAILGNPQLLEAVELPVRNGSEKCPPFDIDELFDTMTIAEQAYGLNMDNEQVKAALGMTIEELDAELHACKTKHAEGEVGFTEYE